MPEPTQAEKDKAAKDKAGKDAQAAKAQAELAESESTYDGPRADETVPGGAYFMGGRWVNADGEEIEKPEGFEAPPTANRKRK